MPGLCPRLAVATHNIGWVLGALGSLIPHNIVGGGGRGGEVDAGAHCGVERETVSADGEDLAAEDSALGDAHERALADAHLAQAQALTGFEVDPDHAPCGP